MGTDFCVGGGCGGGAGRLPLQLDSLNMPTGTLLQSSSVWKGMQNDGETFPSFIGVQPAVEKLRRRLSEAVL